MTTQPTKTDDEARIRALIDDWVEASRAKDVDRVMAVYAPDVRSFDAIGQLQFKGREAYRKHWEACVAMCPGPMNFEVHDLDITVHDDVAFCHYLGSCGGTGPDGKEHSGWMRATVCFRNTDGQWKIVHEHFSTPFDPETGKALLDLQPDHLGRTRAA